MAGAIAIGGHTVGPGNPAFLIAEVAQSHDGSLGLAHAFVDGAAGAGADVVKFQTHIAAAESTLAEAAGTPFSTQDDTRHDYWKRMEFSAEQWAGLAAHAAHAGPVFVAAAAFASAEPQGPVVVELTEGQAGFPDPTPTFGDDGDVLKAVEGAGRPIVIAGSFAIRQGWGEALGQLSIPVFTTASAKGLIDETLPHAVGVYTGAGLAETPEVLLMAETDLVVGLGLRAGEVLGANGLPKPAVNIDALAAADGFGFAAQSGPGATAGVLAALAEKEWGMARTQLVVGKLRVGMLDGRFQPAQIFEAVDRRFEGQVRAVFDTGRFCTIGEHAWRARRPDWCLMSGNGRCRGTAIPMGLGAALHDGGVPTVIFVGDGGIGAPLAELNLAVGHKLPVMVVLVSGGGDGVPRTRGIRDGLTQPPWLATVSALGMPGVRVESAAAFNDALDHWQPGGGPVFIEAAFDPQVYRDMVQGIR